MATGVAALGPEQAERGKWLRLGIWLGHFVLLGLLALLGPAGPLPDWLAYGSVAAATRQAGQLPCEYCGQPGRPIPQRDGSELVACTAHLEKAKAGSKSPIGGGAFAFGTIWFLVGAAFPYAVMLDAFKAARGRKTHLTDEGRRLRDALPSALFVGGFAVFCDVLLLLVAGRWGLYSGRLSAEIFLSNAKSFVTWRGIAWAAVATAIWTVYSGLWLVPDVYSVPAGAAASRRSRLASLFRYAMIATGVSTVSVAISGTAIFLLVVIFGSAGESMTSEIHREYGPGLSRSVPYGLMLAGGGLLSFGLSIWMVFVMPTLMTIRVNRWYCRRIGREEPNTGAA